MNLGLYILKPDGNTPEPCPDLMTWARWIDILENRRVKWETVAEGVEVSTVFLGIDHAYGALFGGGGPPILWETIIFGGPLDQQMRRCGGNREQAEAMHQEMVAAALAAAGGKHAGIDT